MTSGLCVASLCGVMAPVSAVASLMGYTWSRLINIKFATRDVAQFSSWSSVFVARYFKITVLDGVVGWLVASSLNAA